MIWLFKLHLPNSAPLPGRFAVAVGLVLLRTIRVVPRPGVAR